MIFEDDSAVSCDSCDGETSQGTTTSDIAQYTVRLGDIIRRKQIKEGVYTPNIINDVSISFYNNGRYDDEFSKCFDIQELKIDVINLFKKRALQTGTLKITDNDEYVQMLEYIINKHCKHNHHWTFEEFKQYGIQIVFGSKDTECKVSIYQHF